MTDKPKKIEQWAGCGWDDPKPRYSGKIHLGGLDFQRSPTEGPDPAPGAKGAKVSSVRNLKNED